MAWRTKLAELIVDIKTNLAPLRASLSKAGAMMKRSFASMVRVARRAAKYIVVAFVAMGAAVIKFAMEAQESESLFEVSMGRMAKSTRRWSKQMAKALGLNSYEIRKFVGNLNVMLKSMGMVEGEAAKTSKSLVELTYDISSFHDISPEEAFNKIKSSLVGMARPMQDLGYITNAAAVRQYALNQGWIEGTQKLTDLQKLQGRVAIQMKVTSQAQGDLARTGGSATNMLRRMWAVIKEAAIDIGNKLLPRVVEVTGAIIEWVAATKDLVAIRVGEWVDALANALNTLKPVLGFVAAHAKTIVWLLGAWLALPILVFVGRLGKGIWELGKSFIVLNAAAKLWNAKLLTAALHGEKLSGTVKFLTKAWAKLTYTIGRGLRGIVVAFKVFKAATLAARAATLAFFALWAIAIGLAIKLIITLVRWVKLLAKERANAKALTEKETRAYKREHAEKITAAKALHASAKQEVKDVEEVIAARTKLREELAKARKGEKNEVELGRATKALHKAVEKATPEGKEAEKEAAATSEGEAVGIKELRRARLAFLEKVKGSEEEIFKLKLKLLSVEAREIAAGTKGDARKIFESLAASADALDRKAAEEKRKERLGEYKEKLGMLQNLFTDAKGFEKHLHVIKKKLRHEEALDIKQKTGIALELAEALLKAKEAPAEVARAGLVGFQAAWGQISTGAKRVDEQQLTALKQIAEYARREEERVESSGGMQATGPIRHH